MQFGGFSRQTPHPRLASQLPMATGSCLAKRELGGNASLSTHTFSQQPRVAPGVSATRRFPSLVDSVVFLPLQRYCTDFQRVGRGMGAQASHPPFNQWGNHQPSPLLLALPWARLRSMERPPAAPERVSRARCPLPHKCPPSSSAPVRRAGWGVRCTTQRHRAVATCRVIEAPSAPAVPSFSSCTPAKTQSSSRGS